MEIDEEVNNLKQEVRTLTEDINEAQIQLKKDAHRRDAIMTERSQASGQVRRAAGRSIALALRRPPLLCFAFQPSGGYPASGVPLDRDGEPLFWCGWHRL